METRLYVVGFFLLYINVSNDGFYFRRLQDIEETGVQMPGRKCELFFGGGKLHTYHIGLQYMHTVSLSPSPSQKCIFMSKALRLIGYAKQNHICRVLRLLSNMVLQAQTTILSVTPVIFIKWHPCKIKSF